jgi:hypothetical protein
MELFNTTFFTNYENMEFFKSHKNLHAYHVLLIIWFMITYSHVETNKW